MYPVPLRICRGRDALHRVVIPEFREFAREYGRSVDFIDLRWGISTDGIEGDESLDKILSVCLDEIELCSPYQIVILGERYGWMPSPDLLTRAAERKSFMLEDNRISVTELEILYGMYKNRGMLDRCIFCLRELIDPALLSEEERAIYISEDEGDRERELSIIEMEKYLDTHREQTGGDIFRLKRLLDWNKNFTV